MKFLEDTFFFCAAIGIASIIGAGWLIRRTLRDAQKEIDEQDLDFEKIKKHERQ